MIDEMIEKLFLDLPYSETVDEAKARIREALQEEYEKERESYNELQAAGRVMGQYGTLEEAGCLAGYSKQEVEAWADVSLGMDVKEFRKVFRKERRFLYLKALAIAAVVNYLLNFLIFKELGLFIFIAVSAAIGLLCHRTLARMGQARAARNICLLSETYEALKEQSDQYGKRLMNCLTAAIGICALVVFNVSCFVSRTYMKEGELGPYVASWMTLAFLGMFICLKNFLCRRWLETFYRLGKEENFRQHLLRVLAAVGIYWFVVDLVLFILRDRTDYIHNWFLGFALIYVIALLVYNLTLRRTIVFKNIKVNKKRTGVMAMLVVVVTVYQVLKMDSWVIQPYISTVSAFEYEKCPIVYDEDTGIYTIMMQRDEFKILQLTDIHLGGSAFSASKDLKALKAVYRLVEYAKPDFVVVTGDLVFPMGIMSFSLNNYTPVMQFASFMRNMDIPWAFIYGNHDTESMAVSGEEELAELFRSVSFKSSQNLLYPYIQPDIMGRNNQIIEIRNQDGSINQALFLLDSNDYTDEGINTYDYIHDDQVEWYERQVKQLSGQEEVPVSSMIFFHMPLQEYREAYELYEQGSNEVIYYFGEIGETMINKICCSDYPSKLFDTAVRLGSTKAMFCGHDHYNNLSVEYQGIRLTYGMSIDYLAMPGIDKDTKQRGGTLITLQPDSKFEIEQIKLADIL